MTIEEAIKKALASGWKAKGFTGPKQFGSRVEWLPLIVDPEQLTTESIQAVVNFIFEQNLDAQLFLMPSFWQSLGKAIGWEIPQDYRPHRKGLHSDDFGPYADNSDCYCDQPLDWKGQWNRFIDHLAEGKSADSFFESLK
jgi:hypothetical protein